jgi:putative Mg2+ transporter-C (MgtC) family protein
MFPEIILQLALAVFYGAIIGFEREYRSKAAGFRTITMITLGATLFTILSSKFGNATSADRIASNIVMGIGFIGAGVIFKDAYAVSGLTTASCIWVSAAIGMAIGLSEYMIASVTVLFALIVLALFERIQDWIDRFHQIRTYRIVLHLDYLKSQEELEARLKSLALRFKIKKCFRTTDDISFFYIVSGKSKRLDEFALFLVNSRDIKSFDE